MIQEVGNMQADEKEERRKRKSREYDKNKVWAPQEWAGNTVR